MNKIFEVIENKLFDLMNSPQPLSASQRGAKKILPLLLLARESRLRDRRSQRGRGDEYM
jgi:hypothetical protein